MSKILFKLSRQSGRLTVHIEFIYGLYSTASSAAVNCVVEKFLLHDNDDTQPELDLKL